MILLKLDFDNSEPIYKQIYIQIIERIEKNILKPGDRLPSSRRLANQLGINRTTVYKAYQELWSKGYIESKQGSYSIIRKRVEVKKREEQNSVNAVNWEKKITPPLKKLCYDVLLHRNKKRESDKINFVSLSPDPRLVPVERFRKCLNEVLLEGNASLLDYSDPFGYKPLRKFIMEQMQRHSIYVSEEEIVLVNGSQNGIELILKLLVKPVDKIITESPTYSSAIPLFKYYANKVIEIPIGENGINLNSLEKKIKKEKPALIYTIPNFHNPTGLTSTQTNREELLKMCEQNKIPLVEDGFSEEMKYYGKNILPIKSMDKQNIVIYIGTFSKVLFPGLRIGWIAADKKCTEHIASMKQSGELSGVALTQAALYRFCEKGYYELHIKKIHKVYKKRMYMAINAMKEHIPSKKFSYTKPYGGYTIWVETKDRKIDEEELVNKIADSGVAVSPGKIYYPQDPNKASFRISIAKVDENEIVEGIKRIAEVLSKI